MGLTKKHINYLIRRLRSDRAIIRNFWKSVPRIKKSSPEMTEEYKLQLEIIKVLQSLKETL